MKAVKVLLAGSVAAASLISAAPAAAQYYPGYGYGGNVVGQVLQQVLGGGYGYQGYGMNPQQAVDRCAAAVTQRISRNYGGYAPYGGYGGYGYGYQNAARVVGITSVERRSNGLRVRGVATSGVNAGYGYGYAGQPNLSFKCNIDYRGYISDIDLDRYASNYGYNYQPYGYTGSNNYYGYRRY